MDIVNDIKFINFFPAQVVAGSLVVGTPVDISQYGSPAVNVNVGVPGITLSAVNRFDLILEHAPDSDGVPGVWEFVPDEYLFGQESEVNSGVWASLIDNAQGSKVYLVQYRGSNAWLRLSVEGVGTHSTGTAFAGDMALGGNFRLPVSND